MITATHKGRYYNVEYSIVNVSELEGELRIDAEYYEPFYLEQIKKIIKNKWSTLLKLLEEQVYNGYDYRKFEDNGIPYIRVGDIKDFIIDLNSAVKVKPKKIPKKITLKNGDILFTRKGTVGEVSIIHPYITTNQIISSEIMKIRVNSYKINPYYLMTFLKSHFGKIQIIQNIHGIAHVSITQEALENIKIPIPSSEFQKFIEKLVLKAYEERKKAEELYKQAKEILLEELGLKNWKLKTKKIKIGGKEFEEEENISIRMLSEVIKADRMDAEYWEPKYDKIEELIKDYKNGYSIIRSEFLHKTDKMRINKDQFYNYVEISSVNTSTGDFTSSYLKGEELPANAKLKLEENDLIVSKVRTYRKGIALIKKQYSNLIGSSAFVVLHEKEDKQINIETLFVFLRTDVFSLWSYKFYTGTSYPTLTDEDILNLPIPKVDQQTQQKISQLIQQSFKARENSKNLLEIAKRTVEIYIEKDEKNALSWAKNNFLS